MLSAKCQPVCLVPNQCFLVDWFQWEGGCVWYVFPYPLLNQHQSFKWYQMNYSHFFHKFLDTFSFIYEYRFKKCSNSEKIMVYWVSFWLAINSLVTSVLGISVLCLGSNELTHWGRVTHASVNSPPSLVQIRAGHLVSPKPLSEPILEYC